MAQLTTTSYTAAAATNNGLASRQASVAAALCDGCQDLCLLASGYNGLHACFEHRPRQQQHELVWLTGNAQSAFGVLFRLVSSGRTLWRFATSNCSADDAGADADESGPRAWCAAWLASAHRTISELRLGVWRVAMRARALGATCERLVTGGWC